MPNPPTTRAIPPALNIPPPGRPARTLKRHPPESAVTPVLDASPTVVGSVAARGGSEREKNARGALADYDWTKLSPRDAEAACGQRSPERSGSEDDRAPTNVR